MKKVFKFFLTLIIINFIISFSFLVFLGYNIVFPCLKNTDIIFSDLFKKELDPVKYQKLEQNIAVRSKNFSKYLGQKLTERLKVLFPTPNFNYSNMPPVEYPFPSLDEVMKMNEANAQKGIEKGLKNLEVQEKISKNALQQGLKCLEKSNNN